MPKVKYVGSFDEVEFENDTGAWLTCKKDATVDVSAGLAASMLEQTDNWTSGTTAPTTPEEG